MKMIEKSEAAWRGEISPMGAPVNELSKLTMDVWFFNGMSNMVVVNTAEGLVIIDPGAMVQTASSDGTLLPDCQRKHQAVVESCGQPVSTVIYTHGHIDHIYGVEQYRCDSRRERQPLPNVIAQEAFAARAFRYRMTSGYNDIINGRQFGGSTDMDAAGYSEDFTYPNILFRDELDLKIGGKRILVRHGRGETDDHAWIYLPDERIVCTGDFFIWAMPNAGNPQKVQRYSLEWATALRRMANLQPEILAPGHGVPIIGQERVSKALDDTATLLEHIHNQVLQLMNKGLRLERIIESVKIPDDLINLPYLRPSYDEPEFIIRNIWRHYGGWYDGVPSHLKPASEKALAREVISLIGDQDKLMERVEKLMAEGDIRVATHLAEWTCLAGADNAAAQDLAKRVYLERSRRETSVMARGVYSAAANEISD